MRAAGRMPVRSGRSSGDDDIQAMLYRGLLAAHRGDRALAERWLDLLANTRDINATVPAEIAAAMGDRARAFGFLTQAAQDGGDWLGVHRSAAWDPYRKDPEFQALTRPRG